MDPVATLRMFKDAMTAHDREAVAESADALIGWLSRDGFNPFPLDHWQRLLTPRQLLAYLRDVRSVAEMA